MEHRKYPTILPRPAASSGVGEDVSQKIMVENPISLKRPQKRVKAACEACRARKSKVKLRNSSKPANSISGFDQCSGTRPSCWTCEKKHIRCVYLVGPGKSYYEEMRDEVQRLQNELHAQGRNPQQINGFPIEPPLPSSREPPSHIQSSTQVSREVRTLGSRHGLESSRVVVTDHDLFRLRINTKPESISPVAQNFLPTHSMTYNTATSSWSRASQGLK
ncbi:hypothetical protein BX600DRAFT_493515 [Xylariales sp. PMI_506]|nr:hypothetical protein BX600DRAFT_493515 [Xylariales sp. PMI_506]